MGFRIARTLSLAAALAATGCATRGQMDLLESRLRAQEDSIQELHAQLGRTESDLLAARRESARLQAQIAEGPRTATAEQAVALGKAEGIGLNKLLTGGLDRDGIAGDEIFSAVIVPTDSQGNLVKVPGSIQLTVLDLGQPEGEQQVGRWEYDAEQCDALWHNGFLGSGFVVRVPWMQTPSSADLLVHARLKVADGRQFDASQEIHITPPAAAVVQQAAGTK